MQRQTLTRTATLGLLLAALALPVAWASLITNSPNLPPLAGKYVTAAQVHANYGGMVVVKDVSHSGFTDSFPPPPLHGSSAHSFGSSLDMMVSPDGGAHYSPISAPGAVTVRVDHSLDLGPVQVFDTEMLQLDISGGSLPPGVMIRESPTLPSLGRTTIEDLGGGMFRIDSFFDVFTELSVDGGQLWIPSNGSARVDLVPVPESTGTLALLLVPLGLYGVSRVRTRLSAKE